MFLCSCGLGGVKQQLDDWKLNGYRKKVLIKKFMKLEIFVLAISTFKFTGEFQRVQWSAAERW
jgi:hypothetical protein